MSIALAAAAELVAQTRPSGTAAVNALTAGELALELTLIVVCNTSASPADFSIFHDDAGGSTYDQTTALYYAQQLAANTSLRIPAEMFGAGVTLKTGGQIGVQSSVANALTFSMYGVTEAVAAERLSTR